MFKIDFHTDLCEFYLSIWNPKSFFDSDCKDDVVQLNYAIFILCRKSRPYRHHQTLWTKTQTRGIASSFIMLIVLHIDEKF
jgi:hypothetical protein